MGESAAEERIPSSLPSFSWPLPSVSTLWESNGLWFEISTEVIVDEEGEVLRPFSRYIYIYMKPSGSGFSSSSGRPRTLRPSSVTVHSGGASSVTIIEDGAEAVRTPGTYGEGEEGQPWMDLQAIHVSTMYGSVTVSTHVCSV